MDGMTTIPGEFDPDNAITTGKGKIVSLVLPTAAESIKAETIPNTTFRYFTALAEINAARVTDIDEWAFYNCYALTTADFPRAETIGNFVFGYTGTRSLTVILGNTAPALGSGLFDSVTSTKTVIVQVPSGATGYTSAWQNNFTGGNTYINLTIE
jgi:hypothetical protein